MYIYFILVVFKNLRMFEDIIQIYTSLVDKKKNSKYPSKNMN